MPEEVHVRTFPCYCKNCLEERYLACENREFAGDFELQVLRKKGERTPGTRFNEEARTSILNGRWKKLLEADVWRGGMSTRL